VLFSRSLVVFQETLAGKTHARRLTMLAEPGKGRWRKAPIARRGIEHLRTAHASLRSVNKNRSCANRALGMSPTLKIARARR
jgi:hypothetical protein